jgi:hypothetical protein
MDLKGAFVLDECLHGVHTLFNDFIDFKGKGVKSSFGETAAAGLVSRENLLFKKQNFSPCFGEQIGKNRTGWTCSHYDDIISHRACLVIIKQFRKLVVMYSFLQGASIPQP